MASSAMRRSLLRRGSLRGLVSSGAPSAAAGASSFRRSFQSGEHESPADFHARIFGEKGLDDRPSHRTSDVSENPRGRYGVGSWTGVFGEAENEYEDGLMGQKGRDDRPLFRKLDEFDNTRGRYGMGSERGFFGQHGDRGNFGFSGRSDYGFGGIGSSESMDGSDSTNDGMDEKLKDAAHSFEFDVTNEVWEEGYEFRPDVNYRPGSTYTVRDLDLTRPAAPKNPRRQEFETTTAEVLKKADFRNVRFLANFLTEAGIIIKRSQTKISAKAQRKVAREIKIARALGLMPFTTMGRKPFMFGRTAEEDIEEEVYDHNFNFVEDKEVGPEDGVGDTAPDVETA